MDHQRFLSSIDRERIRNAIEHAEAGTTGKIHLFISETEDHDPLEQAKSRFLELRLDQTEHRNAVLIYIAPRTNRFAVVGDVGIHERCGDLFWQRLTDAMSSFLREEQVNDAMVLAIKKCGRLLREHFPCNGTPSSASTSRPALPPPGSAGSY